MGLGKIKQLFRERIQDLPGKIEEKIKKLIRDRVPGVAGATSSVYGGQVGQRYQFAYKGKSYELIVARQSKKVAPGQRVYVIRIIRNGKVEVELDQKQIETNTFPTAAAKTAMLMHFGSVLSAANALEAGLIKSRETAQLKRKARRNGKSGVTGTPSNQGNTQKVELAKLARDLRTAVGSFTAPNIYTGLLHDLAEYGCALLNAGCFAAGTKLWTPDGYRNVEELRVGDLVFSRDESRPDGLIEAKPVEAVFIRLTEIVHLHVGGQTIRTTQEHPFFVYNRGWVPLVEITAGEYILTESGDWKRVDDVYFTGEIETVYNLRIADWHTYFVGDNWGWAAWAHNACIEYVQVDHTMAVGMSLATSAWQYRQQKATSDPRPVVRAAWAAGQKTAAMASAQSYKYGSGDTGHAEEQMIRGLSGLGVPSPGNPIQVLFVERRPCTTGHNCQQQLEDWLKGQGGVIVLYYLIPHVENELGSVLLSRYQSLGIGS